MVRKEVTDGRKLRNLPILIVAQSDKRTSSIIKNSYRAVSDCGLAATLSDCCIAAKKNVPDLID